MASLVLDLAPIWSTTQCPGTKRRDFRFMFKALVRWLLTLLFRIKISGMEHYAAAGDKVLIIANHTSFLDGILLTLFLPDRLTFAVNTHIAKKSWARPFLRQVGVVSLDTSRPYALRSLLQKLRNGQKVVMFPEGRITLTGTLMKTYAGTGLLAMRSQAVVLPVAIDGPQFSPLSRLRGHMRLRWFPGIRLTLLPPRRLPALAESDAHRARALATRYIADTMAEMVFSASPYRMSLFQALLAARTTYGGRTVIAEDGGRQALNFNQLVRRALQLAKHMAPHGRPGERVAILLPNGVDGLLSFFATLACGRVLVMLDIDRTHKELMAYCRLVGVHTVYTRRDLLQARAWPEPSAWQPLTLRFVDDEQASAGIGNALGRFMSGIAADRRVRRLGAASNPDDLALVFITTNAGEAAKAVGLSHANILANCYQLRSRLDTNMRDVVLNCLPLSSAYGLNTATLLPLFSGIKVFFYAITRPLRAMPEVAYEISASILFGNDRILSRVGQAAHVFDFHRTRYVFAAGGSLQDATRELWQQRFGIRILEAYGKTETGPVLSVNTPIEHRSGSVGRFLPGVAHRLQAREGSAAGAPAQLWVQGPNIMLGYIEGAASPQLPPSEFGPGWFATGDAVTLDAAGFVSRLEPCQDGL